MLLRQKHAKANWTADPRLQRVLAAGVQPLFYIGEDEHQKIRHLQQDIRSIQQAGLSRLIRVLHPAPPFVTASSIRTSVATKLVNPKIFPITSMLLLDHPSPVTRTLGESTKMLSQRLLVITMDTKGGDANFPVSTDSRPLVDGQWTPSMQARLECARQNLLVLIRKDDDRLPMLSGRLPMGCRCQDRPLLRPIDCLSG